ncbi:MAG: hypothetical protein JWQ27_69 [Ferruginibacter sp.]|nr:hypothetical protein [Ferruginibacter sp.]
MTLLIIAGILLYCWITFLTTDVEATWRHYFGLLFFLLICICFFRNLAITTIATGVYLILGTFDLLALTPTISTFGFRFGPVSTPDIQGLSLGLFILYFILNMDPLIDIYLDYKEMKSNQND